HVGIEITRRLAIDQVTLGIALPRFDQRQVRDQSFLEHVSLTVRGDRWLAFGDLRAHADFGVKPINARTAGAYALRKGTLRIELDFDLTGQILAFEFLVLAHIRGKHFADLMRLQQQPQTHAVETRIVGYDGEIAHARRVQGIDQILWDAARAEAAAHQRDAILDHTTQCRCGVGVDLGTRGQAHRTLSPSTDTGRPYTDLVFRHRYNVLGCPSIPSTARAAWKAAIALLFRRDASAAHTRRSDISGCGRTARFAPAPDSRTRNSSHRTDGPCRNPS